MFIYHPGEKITTQGYVVVLIVHDSMLKLSCMRAEMGVRSSAPAGFFSTAETEAHFFLERPYH